MQKDNTKDYNFCHFNFTMEEKLGGHTSAKMEDGCDPLVLHELQCVQKVIKMS